MSEGIKTSAEAMAEAMENNIRRFIIDLSPSWTAHSPTGARSAISSAAPRSLMKTGGIERERVSAEAA